MAASTGAGLAANQGGPESPADTAAACAAEATPAASQASFESGTSGATAERYAPLVFLHPKEKFRPMSAACFIEHSSLQFAQGRHKQSEKAQLGDLTADMLLQSSFDTDGFTTQDKTRPFEKGRAEALKGRRGFYLDVDDRFRVGAPSTEESVLFAGTPVYYQYELGQFVTYWFFYGYSAPGGLLARNLRKSGIKRAGHEGDWEGISIQLDPQDHAVSAAYFAHGETVEPLAWADVKKLDGHPIVFSALGSHASYTTAGTKRANFDVTGGGPIWATWLLIADARLQPWYRFGGAWGLARVVPAAVRNFPGLRGRVGESEFTGPIGPRFKGLPFGPRAKPTKSSPIG